MVINKVVQRYYGKQLQGIVDRSIQHVLNLHPSSEKDSNESEVVEALGMSYHQFEVAAADNLSVADAQQ